MMTPEQKAANEAIGEAIKSAQRAYGYDERFMVTDWVVLTAETRFDDDGEQISAYARIYQNGSMPDYRVLGLLEVHASYVRDHLREEQQDEG
jgi:hypothetical protein